MRDFTGRAKLWPPGNYSIVSMTNRFSLNYRSTRRGDWTIMQLQVRMLSSLSLTYALWYAVRKGGQIWQKSNYSGCRDKVWLKNIRGAELKALGDYQGLAKLPRNFTNTLKNRCLETGRAHGICAVWVSRLSLRKCFKGEIGVTKPVGKETLWPSKFQRSIATCWHAFVTLFWCHTEISLHTLTEE